LLEVVEDPPAEAAAVPSPPGEEEQQCQVAPLLGILCFL
jgi:hypothetical protein